MLTSPLHLQQQDQTHTKQTLDGAPQPLPQNLKTVGADVTAGVVSNETRCIKKALGRSDRAQRPPPRTSLLTSSW